MKKFSILVFAAFAFFAVISCQNKPTGPETPADTATITRTSTLIFTQTITCTLTITTTPTIFCTPTATPTNTQAIKILGEIYTYNYGTDPTYKAEISVDAAAYEYATVTVKDLTAVSEINVPHTGAGIYKLEIGGGAAIITGHDYLMEVNSPFGVFTAHAAAPGNMYLSPDGQTLTWSDYGGNYDSFYVNKPGVGITYIKNDTPGNNVVNNPETIPASAYVESGVTYYVIFNMGSYFVPANGGFTGAAADSTFFMQIYDDKPHFNP